MELPVIDFWELNCRDMSFFGVPLAQLIVKSCVSGETVLSGPVRVAACGLS